MSLDFRFRPPTLCFPLIATPLEKLHQLALRTLIGRVVRLCPRRSASLRLALHTVPLPPGDFRLRITTMQVPFPWLCLPSAEQKWDLFLSWYSSLTAYSFTSPGPASAALRHDLRSAPGKPALHSGTAAFRCGPAHHNAP